jgi:hypothetical protein
MAVEDATATARKSGADDDRRRTEAQQNWDRQAAPDR